MSPGRVPPEAFRAFDTRLLFIAGDRGPNAPVVPALLQDLPHARAVRLHDHADSAWADTVAERQAEVEAALREFFDEMTIQEHVPEVHLQSGAGEVAGITYQVRGSGPPLLLLPLGLARSQWDPAVDQLAERYTTIVLGGAFLGLVPRSRRACAAVTRPSFATWWKRPDQRQARSSGSRVRLRSSCALVSELCGRRQSATGVDVNAYLLREAVALTRSRD